MKLAIAVNKLTLTGGMERYTIELIRASNELGLKPIILTQEYDRSLTEQFDFEPIVFKVSKLWGKLRIYVFAFQLKCWQAKHPEIVLIGCNRNISSHIAIAGGTHLGFLHKRILMRPKNIHFWDLLESKLEAQYYHRAEVIIAHSEAIKRELILYYHQPASKIKVIYPPVDQNIFQEMSQPQRLALRAKYGFSEGDTILLFPSSGHERKGLTFILEQLKRLGDQHNIQLIVLGKKMISDLGLNVTYMPFVDNIQEFYQLADFTILASCYEPFGLIVPESILCGTPCLLSNSIGALEVLSENTRHIFTRHSPETLFNLLSDLALLKKRVSQPQTQINYDMDAKTHLQNIIMCALKASSHLVR